MFHPTENHRGRRTLSHLKISTPEIAAIVGGAVLSIGLLGAIVLVEGGSKFGGISAVTAPSETTLAPLPPAAQAPTAPTASATAVPAPPKARSAATTAAAPAAKPSPKPASAVIVPRPRPAHALAPPPATAAQRSAPSVSKTAPPKLAAPAKTAPVGANASAGHPAAPAPPATKTASAPRTATPAPPIQRPPKEAAPTKPASSAAPAPSPPATAKAAQAGATATTTTPAPSGPVRIVIDYEAAAPGMSDMADQLARKLRETGYKPVEIRPVQFIVSANQVRFFFTQDHDAAKRVEGIVAKVKGPGGADRHFAVTEFAHLKQPPPDNLVEVWLRSW